jgi:hypothetical protein
MDGTMNRPGAEAMAARAEVCGCGGSVVLFLGALSLRLDLAAAEDVVAALNRALSLAASGERGHGGPDAEAAGESN